MTTLRRRAATAPRDRAPPRPRASLRGHARGRARHARGSSAERGHARGGARHARRWARAQLGSAGTVVRGRLSPGCPPLHGSPQPRCPGAVGRSAVENPREPAQAQCHRSAGRPLASRKGTKGASRVSGKLPKGRGGSFPVGRPCWLRAVTPQELRPLPRVRNKQPSWAAWHRAGPPLPVLGQVCGGAGDALEAPCLWRCVQHAQPALPLCP